MADDSATSNDTAETPQESAPSPLLSTSTPPQPASLARMAPQPDPTAGPTDYPSWIGHVNVNPEPATKPAMWNTVVQNAASAGVDPDVMWRMFGSERSYQDKPNPFQVMPNTAAGLRRIYPSQNFGDPNDPVEGARMAPWALSSSNQGLAAALHRAPSPTEQYLGWVFGPKAAGVILANPNTPIDKLLPQDWIDRNPNRTRGPDGQPITPVTTAGELKWWAARRMGYDNPYSTGNVGDASGMPKVDPAVAPAPPQRPAPDFSNPQGDWAAGIKLGRDSSGPVQISGVQPQVRAGLYALSQSFGPIQLNSTTGGGHNDGSYHYRGLAADLDTSGMSQDKVADLITKARQAGFTGIGIDGVHVHVDMRPGALTVFPDDHYTGPVGGLDPKGWQAKLAGVKPGQNLADQPSSVSIATSSPLMPPTDAERAQRDAANYERGYSTAGGIWETVKNDSLTAGMLRSMNVPQPDPNYNLTQETITQDKRVSDMPEPWQESLLASVSQPDYESRVADLQRRADYQDRIAQMGGKGTFAQLVGNLLDPVGLAVGAIPMAGGPRAASVLGRVLWGAGTGAIGGGMTEAARWAVDPTWTKDALLKGAAMGLVGGAILGPLAKVHPALEPERVTLAGSAKGIGESLDRRYATGEPKPSEPLSTPPPSVVGRAGADGQITYLDPGVYQTQVLQRAGEIDPVTVRKATELDEQMSVVQAQLAGMANPIAERLPDAERPARIAQGAARIDPDTMGAASALDKSIEGTRKTIADLEATKPHLEANSTEQWLKASDQERLTQVNRELAAITGKRRSGPAAKALQAERDALAQKAADAQQEALTRYGTDSGNLRNKIVDLQSQRGQLGPKVKAATDQATVEEEARSASQDLLREKHEDAKAVLQDKLAKMQAQRERLSAKAQKAMDAAEAEAQRLGIKVLDPEEPHVETPAPTAAAPEENLGQLVSNKSAGAAATPGTVRPMRVATDLWMHGRTTAAYSNTKVAFKKFRIDLAGSLRASDNPVINALGTYMAADRVGNADHSALPLNIASEEVTHGMHVTQSPLIAQHIAGFKSWAKARGFNNIISRLQNFDKFQKLVSDAVAERDPNVRAQMDPDVLRAADGHKAFYADYWERMQNPGVHDGTTRAPLDGAAGVPKDANYIPHIWDFQKFQDTVNRFGDTEVKRLLRESIAKQFGGKITTVALEKFTKALFKGLRSAQTGQEISMSKMLSGEDMPGLAFLLRNHTNSSDAEIDSIMGMLSKPDETGKIGRMKERTPYAENHSVDLTDPKTGAMVPTRIRDMLNWNSLDVARMYSRSMEGHLALARVQIPNPIYDEGLHGPGGVLEGDHKPFLADGIAKDSDWDALMKTARDVGSQMGHPIDQTERTLGHLNFIRDRIMGKPDPLDLTRVGASLRILQNYNLARVLNQVGFMHMSQGWQALSQVGLKAAWKAMPGFRAFIRDAQTGQLSDDLSRMIEQSLGIGTDWLRGAGTPLPMDDFMGNVASSPFKTAERVSQGLARTTTAIGGLAPMMTTFQRWAARAAMVRFAMDAAGEKALNANRMAALGIEPVMQGRIAAALQKDGIATGNTGAKGLAGLQLDKWDPDVRHAFTTALTRWTNKMMQENDIGQMNMMFGTRVGKLMTQFRSFMFGAYANNTLHNLHMRDSETVSGVLGSSVLGALSYVAQTHAQSIGRPDQQDFLNKKLDLEHIAAAAIHRGGWASIAPPLIDTALTATGFDPMFDVRGSGQSSSGLLSVPAASLVDDVTKASRGIFGTVVRGEPWSKKDASALRGALPFGNALPILWAANHLTSGLPTKDTHQIGKHTQGRF